MGDCGLWLELFPMPVAFSQKALRNQLEEEMPATDS